MERGTAIWNLKDYYFYENISNVSIEIFKRILLKYFAGKPKIYTFDGEIFDESLGH